jgi:hypothetical protein
VPGAPAIRREPGGALTQLPPPPSPYVRTFTWAINNPGTVAGRYEYNIGSEYFSKAFLWSPESGLTYIGIPHNHVRVKGLNDLGQAIGESGSNQNSYLAAWLWTPQGGSENLNSLIDPTFGIVTNYAYALNNSGQIVAGGSRQNPVGSLTFVMTPVTCYANCDNSTAPPVLNVNDFSCFLNRFAAGDSTANCDQSTTAPVLNVNDFSCFLNRYAAGCP